MNLNKIKEKIALKLIKSIIDSRQKNKWKEGDFLKYSGPYYDHNEYTSAVETLLKGWFILGEKGREFEKQFAPKLGKEDGIFVNSGSSANLLMVSVLKSSRGWNLKSGNKFITPVVCFPTTINPLIQNGFEPVFVDVELPNLNLNLDQVEKLLEEDINKEIKGIIFAHVLGNPPDMDRLLGIIKKYNLIYLEDACDSLGSTWRDKPLGSFGDISTCSFFPAHHMTTGEGGFVATNSSRVRMALASFRDWGRACYCNTKKPGDVTEGTACGCRLNTWFKNHKDITYDHRYVFEEIGYNLKPTELQASLGLEQLKKLPIIDAKRKLNYSHLYNTFKKYEDYFYLPYSLPQADPSWFGFLLTLKDNVPFTKEEFVSYLEDNKIQTRSYFTGNALFHPAYSELAKKYVDPSKEFPIATKSTKDTFFLGVAPQIDNNQLEYIRKIVNQFFEKQ